MNPITKMALERVLKQYLETKDINQAIEDIGNIFLVPHDEPGMCYE